MSRKRQADTFVYKVADFLSAMLSWACFFIYRKCLEGSTFDGSMLDDPNFWYGIFLIPTGWVLFYAIFDQYKDIYRLSRLATLARTIFLSFFGVTFLFFTLILDDFVTNYTTYYNSFLALFLSFPLLTVSSVVTFFRPSVRPFLLS